MIHIWSKLDNFWVKKTVSFSITISVSSYDLDDCDVRSATSFSGRERTLGTRLFEVWVASLQFLAGNVCGNSCRRRARCVSSYKTDEREMVSRPSLLLLLVILLNFWTRFFPGSSVHRTVRATDLKDFKCKWRALRGLNVVQNVSKLNKILKFYFLFTSRGIE